MNLREHKIAGSQMNLDRKQLIRQICEQTLPNFQLLRKQAEYFRHMAIPLIKDELYHALHTLSPVSVIRYNTRKRALPRVKTLLDNQTTTLELWLSGHNSVMARNYMVTANGPALFSHQLQLYLNSLKKKYVRLQENLVTELRLLLRSIAILSRGYLPPQLFSPINSVHPVTTSPNHDKEATPRLCTCSPHISLTIMT